jgi:prophage tail gpP-like protein
MTSNTVTLRVNGLVYGGWKKVRIAALDIQPIGP